MGSFLSRRLFHAYKHSFSEQQLLQTCSSLRTVKLVYSKALFDNLLQGFKLMTYIFLFNLRSQTVLIKLILPQAAQLGLNFLNRKNSNAAPP